MIKILLSTNLLIQMPDSNSLKDQLSSLPVNETIWVEGKLSNSYENEIFSSVLGTDVGSSLEEYRRAFRALDLKPECMEIKREIASFEGTEDLMIWIASQVGEEKAEECFEALKQRGWIDSKDGKVQFPIRKMIVRLKRVSPSLETVNGF